MPGLPRFSGRKNTPYRSARHGVFKELKKLSFWD